jgi:hypothetical protein
MMDVRDRFSAGDDPEPLRRLLRRYQVAPPPPEIEAALRATFRRRARKRRLFAGLAIAAGLLLAMGLVIPRSKTSQDTDVVRRAVPTPPPAMSSHIESRPLLPRAVATQVPRRRPRPPTMARPSEPEVIVEPGQMELVMQLARRFQRARVAPSRDVAATAVTRWEVERVEIGPADVEPATGSTPEPAAGL